MFVELVNNHDAQKATVSSQKNVPVVAKKLSQKNTITQATKGNKK